MDCEPSTTILVLHQGSINPRPFIQPSDSAINTGRDEASSSGSGSTLRHHQERQNGFEHKHAPELENETEHELESGPEHDRIPWTILNKYYSAEVSFHLVPLDEFAMNQAEGVDVVIYLFGEMMNSLPSEVVRLMAQPRDIALAIHLSMSSGTQTDVEEINASGGTSGSTSGIISTSTANDDDDVQNNHKNGIGMSYISTSSALLNNGPAVIAGASWDEIEEMFDEIGMEAIDEDAPVEDDDERPMPLDERVRQTLMTHMWPNMQRLDQVSSPEPRARPRPSGSNSDRQGVPSTSAMASLFASLGIDLDLDEEELAMAMSRSEGDGLGGQQFPRDGLGQARTRLADQVQDQDRSGGGGVSFPVSFPAFGESGPSSFSTAHRGSQDRRRHQSGENGELSEMSPSPEISIDAGLNGGTSAGTDTGTAFPGLEELRSQILLGEQQDMTGLERLERLEREMGLDLGLGLGAGGEAGDDDNDDGWDDDELEAYGQLGGADDYARLEDWLDDDDGGDQPEEMGDERNDDDNDREEPGDVNGIRGKGEHADGARDGHIDEYGNQQGVPVIHPEAESTSQEVSATRPDDSHTPTPDDTNSFDDDFSDFQSGMSHFPGSESDSRSKNRHAYNPLESASGSANNQDLTLDPTPLLLHLQSVREELAAVDDDDERRVRAGKEVLGLMRSLGLAGWDEEDEDEVDAEGLGSREALDIDGLKGLARR